MPQYWRIYMYQRNRDGISPEQLQLVITSLSERKSGWAWRGNDIEPVSDQSVTQREFENVLRLVINLINAFVGLIVQRLDVHVDGVEITQAIQYYHSKLHLADPAQQGLDNSVRLIAGKPAWVRVYLRPGLRSFGIDRATLEVRRLDTHGIYQKVATLAAQPPGELIAQTNPPYAMERGSDINLPLLVFPGSLNFAIPADMMVGSLLFRVIVTEGSGFFSGIRDTHDVYADVHLRQTLRLRAIMIGYAGPKSSTDPAPLFISPPSYPDDLLYTAIPTLQMFPVQSSLDYSSAGFVTWELPLDDAAGCSPNWHSLIAKLIAHKSADGNRPDAIYYGVLPREIPVYGRFGYFCEQSGMSAGMVDAAAEMAHQVGHECGLLHAPGFSNFSALDPDYPAYPPYDPIGSPKGSLGEYGTGIGEAGALAQLPWYKDVMGSLGGPGPWLSLYNYGRLIENPMLNPVLTGDGITATPYVPYTYARDVGPQPMISIIGLMRSERALEVKSVMRLETRAVSFSVQASGLTAELRDESGEPVAQAPLRMLSPWGGDDGCQCHKQRGSVSYFPCVVQALLPDAGRGALLAIGDGKRDLWVRAASATRPHIESFDASLDQNRLAVRWNVKTGANAAEVWLQWSADGGKIWNALATGLTGNAGVFDGSHLPAGTVTLRLLVSDGFDTGISGHLSVQVPQRPTNVSILTPGDGALLSAGGAMRLWGAATVNGRRAVSVEKAQWLLDGQPVAEGLDAFVLAPPAGEHTLELMVTADRLEGTGSRRFVTVQPATGPERAPKGKTRR